MVFVPGYADQRDDHAQSHADEKRQKGKQQGISQPLYVHLVPVVKDKAFVDIVPEIVQPLGAVSVSSPAQPGASFEKRMVSWGDSPFCHKLCFRVQMQYIPRTG